MVLAPKLERAALAWREPHLTGRPRDPRKLQSSLTPETFARDDFDRGARAFFSETVKRYLIYGDHFLPRDR
jgi:hypothetical protein